VEELFGTQPKLDDVIPQGPDGVVPDESQPSLRDEEPVGSCEEASHNFDLSPLSSVAIGRSSDEDRR